MIELIYIYTVTSDVNQIHLLKKEKDRSSSNLLIQKWNSGKLIIYINKENITQPKLILKTSHHDFYLSRSAIILYSVNSFFFLILTNHCGKLKQNVFKFKSSSLTTVT